MSEYIVINKEDLKYLVQDDIADWKAVLMSLLEIIKAGRTHDGKKEVKYIVAEELK